MRQSGMRRCGAPSSVAVHVHPSSWCEGMFVFPRSRVAPHECVKAHRCIAHLILCLPRHRTYGAAGTWLVRARLDAVRSYTAGADELHCHNAPWRAAPLRFWCLQAINAALAEQDKQVEDIHEQNEHAARRLKELRRHKAFTR